MLSSMKNCAIRQSRFTMALVVGTVLVALAFPVVNGLLVYPAYRNILLERVVHEARLVAHHVNLHFFERHDLNVGSSHLEGAGRVENDKTMEPHSFSCPACLTLYDIMKGDPEIVKIRFFDKQGTILHSTASAEIGTQYGALEWEKYSALTKPYSELGSMEAPRGSLNVMATFVPVLEKGQFVGGLECFLGVTEIKNRMEFIAFASSAAMAILALALIVTMIVLLRKQALHVQLLESTQELRNDVERIVQHDLRSPLASIISGTNFLQSVTTGVDELEILGQMQGAGWRMMRMINSSLDLYKMESGTYEFVPEALNILPVMRRVAMELADLAASRGINIRITCEGKAFDEGAEHIIPAEEMLCHTLLSNLLRNALEAAPCESEVTMNVRQETREHVLSISNIGEVPEDIRETFFEKYVTHGKRTGTGLGTYSARLITETQHGRIELQCGQGMVTLLVCFPLASEAGSSFASE